MEKPIVLAKHIDLKALTILVVDRDPLYLRKVKSELEQFEAQAFTTLRVSAAKEIMLHNYIHAVMCDMSMGADKCLELLAGYKAINPGGMFFILAQDYFSEKEQSVLAEKVDGVLAKPVDYAMLSDKLNRFPLQRRQATTTLAQLEPLTARLKPYFLFRSPGMRQALANLPKIASTDQPVLISGETGTGKELVSRAIHVLSPRVNGPFVAVNCAAIPEGLIEGELFGHEKGAFTGAYKTRKGKFEQANEGTLLLDEIGDMPLALQVRLLRVLEERKLYRVGGEASVTFNVRVLAASRQDLLKAVEAGLFREDLYYRINILRIYLPPLRERVEDIAFLSLHFLEKAFVEMGRAQPFPYLSQETVSLLESLPWKGNVRQLRNAMIRVATLFPHDAKAILPEHIYPHIDEKPELNVSTSDEKAGIFIPVGTSLKKAEEIYIEETLKRANGNKTQAAKILGIGLRTLRRKINEQAG
jgi:DNA-binding NtrC family response regulator